MKHSVYGKKLGRNKNQRTALFKNLVQSLILHGSIKTTESKAKAIKGLVDKIINQAKKTNTQNKEKLVKDRLPFLKNRNSGYTSVVRMGQRKGDGAMMVRLSLLLEEKKEKKK